jgi:hypothetical protein
MKKYLIILALFGITACAENPRPPVKSTMDPAHAEATTASFLATRAAKTVLPAATVESGYFVMLICTDCTAQGVGINIWEFAGPNPGEVLKNVQAQTVVEILDTAVLEDGSIWYQVRLNDLVGWVAANFVKEIDV